MAIQYLASGARGHLREMLTQRMGKTRLDDLLVFAHALSDLCVSLPQDVLLKRVRSLTRMERSADFIFQLIERPRYEKGKEIQQQIMTCVLKSETSILCWAIISGRYENTRMIKGVKNLPRNVPALPSLIFNSFKRELMFQEILEPELHRERKAALKGTGMSFRTLDRINLRSWSTIEQWPSSKDQGFFDAILTRPGVIEKLKPYQWYGFFQVTKNYYCTASIQQQANVLNLCTAGMMSAGYEWISAERYDWFLFHNHDTKSPKLQRAIEHSYEQILATPTRKLPTLLMYIDKHESMREILFRLEVQPRFEKVLLKLPTCDQVKIITKCKLPSRWLERFPHFAEAVLAYHLGL
jgi:hypothetical protein